MLKSKRAHDGRLIQARVSPRFKFDKKIKKDDKPMRQLTAKQLAILIYHFYMVLDNPDIGFPDAEKYPTQFQAELNQMVQISEENLEKLLWCLEMCFSSQIYWNPAGESFEDFVQGMLEKDEKFNRLYCLITRKK